MIEDKLPEKVQTLIEGFAAIGDALKAQAEALEAHKDAILILMNKVKKLEKSVYGKNGK